MRISTAKRRTGTQGEIAINEPSLGEPIPYLCFQIQDFIATSVAPMSFTLPTKMAALNVRFKMLRLIS